MTNKSTDSQDRIAKAIMREEIFKVIKDRTCGITDIYKEIKIIDIVREHIGQHYIAKTAVLEGAEKAGEEIEDNDPCTLHVHREQNVKGIKQIILKAMGVEKAINNSLDKQNNQ